MRFVYAFDAEQCHMGVRQYLYLPQGVMKVVRRWLSRSSSTWWKPQYASATVLNECFGTPNTMSNGAGLW